MSSNFILPFFYTLSFQDYFSLIFRVFGFNEIFISVIILLFSSLSGPSILLRFKHTLIIMSQFMYFVLDCLDIPLYLFGY